MSHEIYVKFSVDDTQRFYDWLHDGINKHAAGYDAFYTLVKDGVASRDFDPHLDIEAREAVAIAEALRVVSGGDNDDASSVNGSADCDDSTQQIELGLTVSTNRISAALNSLYSE
jgi:hypothetical protein